jgi:hypothetical protein
LAQIKNFNNPADVVHKHYAIPREALAANKIDSEVYKVLQEGVAVSKFISSRGLNSRLSSKLCKGMG